MLIFDAFDGPKAFFSDRRAQKNGFKNVSSHKPFSEYDETVLGYQKLKKSVRGLLCREKLENGKKSTVREMEIFTKVASSDCAYTLYLFFVFLLEPEYPDPET